MADRVDEVAGDHRQGVEELADEDAVRREPRRVGGEDRVQVLLVHEEVDVDDEVRRPVRGDRDATHAVAGRAPTTRRARCAARSRSPALRCSRDTTRSAASTACRSMVCDSIGPGCSGGGASPGPSWMSLQSRHVRSSRGYRRSSAGSAQTSGKESDAGTGRGPGRAPRTSDRQARHTSPRGARAAVTAVTLARPSTGAVGSRQTPERSPRAAAIMSA